MTDYVREVRFMRLYNIYYICKNSVEMLENTDTSIQSGNNHYAIENWEETKRVIAAFCTIDCMKNAATDVYNAVPVPVRNDLKPLLPPSGNTVFKEKLRLLIERVQTVIDLYESMNLGEAKVGLEVKIPQPDSFSEYISVLNDLNFVFEQCPYCGVKDERLEFAGTDVGSTWLTFALVSTATFSLLNNIGKLIDKALIVKSHYLTLKMQEEQLELLKQKKEAGAEATEVFQRMKKLTYKQYVDELAEEIHPTNDGEEEAKVEKSLEKLAKLLDKGVEIYTSIETPEEIKAVFPVSDKQETLPEGLMKYLEDKSIE